jgi:hypothetical protein
MDFELYQYLFLHDVLGYRAHKICIIMHDSEAQVYRKVRESRLQFAEIYGIDNLKG